MAQMTPSAGPSRKQREMIIGKGWVQGIALVLLFSFFVMGILTYRTYTASMPEPERTVTTSGELLYTADNIKAGQRLFQARGLMQYGSIMGHGAYLGPDFTAEYLRKATEFTDRQIRAAGDQDPLPTRPPAAAAMRPAR